MSDVGWMQLFSGGKANAAAISERGRIPVDRRLLGEAEWQNMQRNIGRLRADWKWKAIADDHPILQTRVPFETVPSGASAYFFSSAPDRTGILPMPIAGRPAVLRESATSDSWACLMLTAG